MSRYPIGFGSMFGGLWSNRNLLQTSIKREVLGRYKGSVFGVLWSFFNPLLMLAIYTFVFSEIFNARWGTNTESKTEFALMLFAGLIVFNIFSDCMNRAPSLILSNLNYVKRVVYPLEILPVVSLGGALFHALISILVWILAYVLLIDVPNASVMYAPLVIMPFALLVLGLSWFLAAIGVYLRDVNQFINLVTTAVMFLSPIFYPASALPGPYRLILNVNPLTPIIEQLRAVLYFGHQPDFILLAKYSVFSLLIAWMGFMWFQKTRKGFADVL